MEKENLLEVIIYAADNLKSAKAALEDGNFLASLKGVSTDLVEELHDKIRQYNGELIAENFAEGWAVSDGDAARWWAGDEAQELITEAGGGDASGEKAILICYLAPMMGQWCS